MCQASIHMHVISQNWGIRPAMTAAADVIGWQAADLCPYGSTDLHKESLFTAFVEIVSIHKQNHCFYNE